MARQPPSPTLFPYTTLFRSVSLRASKNDDGGSCFGSPATTVCDARRIAGTAWGTRICDASSKTTRSNFTEPGGSQVDRKSTRLNSSHGYISYAVFCLKKKKK